MPSSRGVAISAALGLMFGAMSGARLSAPPTQPDTAYEYEVKAAFIYNFTRYLQWPPPDAPGTFEIAVLGDSAIVKPLQAIAEERTIEGRPIVVRQIFDIASIGGPQILFLAKPAAARLAQVLTACRDKAILTIGEEDGLAADGIAVNFVTRGETLRFEINEGALRRSDIQPSSQLLKLAILVGGTR